MASTLLLFLLLLPPYQGVTPPNPKIPEELPPPGGKQCLLVWPGFQMLKKRARLFFLFTKEPKGVRVLTIKKPKKGMERIELRFKACKAWSKNAWRPLVTYYFPTNLESVVFGDDPKNHELVIELYFKKGLPKGIVPNHSFLKKYPLYELYFEKN